MRALSDALPPVQQYAHAQLERLRAPESTVDEKRQAVAALGAVGGDACLPDLARALRGDPALRDAAHAAMWAVFGRCGDPAVAELMAEAEPLLHAGAEPALARALAIYDEVVARAPRFAEGRNKRATVLYLLQRHREAIAECAEVLKLNPYHFGAASGMGLCHWSLKETAAALRAFEAALEIHPGLSVIARHVEALREEEAAKREALSEVQQRLQQQQERPQQQQQRGGDEDR